jgi:hypothetical protein
MSKMATEAQIENLKKYAKGKLESQILEEFIPLRSALEQIELEKEVPANLEKLKLHNKRYEMFSEDIKSEYDVEFEDIKEWYNKLVPAINKYLGLKVE